MGIAFDIYRKSRHASIVKARRDRSGEGEPVKFDPAKLPPSMRGRKPFPPANKALDGPPANKASATIKGITLELPNGVVRIGGNYYTFPDGLNRKGDDAIAEIRRLNKIGP